LNGVGIKKKGGGECTPSFREEKNDKLHAIKKGKRNHRPDHKKKKKNKEKIRTTITAIMIMN